MRNVVRGLLLAAALTLLVGSLPAWAGQQGPTVITIPDMDCPGCAKRVATRLVKVPGVARVSTDVPNAAATVTPAAQQPSPRALWEAVESAGFKPSRLQGPAGTYTEKPPQ